MRAILGLLRLFAAAAVLLFTALTMIYVVLAAWALWEREIAALGAMFALGTLTGTIAVRMLDELCGGGVLRRRPRRAERPNRAISDLPRARVVSR